jgi:hypothetical protein
VNQAERDELLIRLDERTKDIEKNIKAMKSTLFGNGREGLCDTVNRHQTYLKILGACVAVIPPILAVLLHFIFR